MERDELGFSLEGAEIKLSDFAEALQHYSDLIREISRDASPGVQLAWLVQDLDIGSAHATIRVENAPQAAVEQVRSALRIVGNALARQSPIPFVERIARPAQGLANILEGSELAVHLKLSDDEDIVIEPIQFAARARVNVAYGVVEGKIRTLSERGRLQFTLFDSIHNQAVRCYWNRLGDELHVFRNHVRVEGTVHRSPESGRPIKVDPVRSVLVLDNSTSGGFREARGVAPVAKDSIDSTEAVRRARDA